MTTLIEQPQTTDVSFPVADAAIAEMRDKYMPLKIVGVNDKAGYVMVRQARIEVKEKRCAVENRRKELKADALEWGRKVDAEARRLTSLLTPIEEHLDAQEKAHEAEKERIKREAEESQRRKLQARLDAMTKCRAAVDLFKLQQMSDAEFDACLQVAIEADQRRRDQEEAERIERERLEAERREAEEIRMAEAREKQRIEDERLAAERAELDRVRREQAEAQAKLNAERERLDAEQRKIDAEAAAAQYRSAAENRRKAEQARIEALRPDREKLMGVANAIRAIVIPEVSPDAVWLRNLVVQAVERSASIVESAINNALGEA